MFGVPAIAAAQSVTSITVGAVPEESVTPALWARQTGLFRRSMLDVTIESQKSGSAVAAGVVGGSYAFGKSSLVSLIIAHAKKIPFVLVTGGGLYDARSPNFALVVKTDSPMRKASDLNGKSIAVSAINELGFIGIRAWMDKNGGDSSTLRQLELPISSVADAIAVGRVDAAGLTDPALESAIDDGKVRWLANNFDAIAQRFMYTGWFATADYVAANRSVAVNFARAIAEATSYVNGHVAETVDLLSKFTSIDPAQITKMHRITYSTTLDPALLQPLIDVCARYKVIPVAFDAREMFASHIS